jgi:hypothetical protein
MDKFTISGFEAAILEFWMVMDMPGLCHLIAQTYLGKVTKGFLFVVPKWQRKDRLGRGVILPSPVKL